MHTNEMQTLSFTILGEPASKANSRRMVTVRGRPMLIKSQKALSYAEGFQKAMHLREDARRQCGGLDDDLVRKPKT
jgi:hypothetical protein